MITAEQVETYLRKHAPEIAALLEKEQPFDGIKPSLSGTTRYHGIDKEQPSVGDVHVTSTVPARRRKKRRAMSFKSAIVNRKARVTNKGEAFSFEMDIAKIDEDKQQVFGWASVSTISGDHVIDKQGDIIPVEELEKAAYEFVQFSRDMGDMHSRLGTGRMIESVVFTKEKAACGIIAKDEDGNTVEGWWVGFAVLDPASWQSFKSGERPELSIGGRASWEDQ